MTIKYGRAAFTGAFLLATGLAVLACGDIDPDSSQGAGGGSGRLGSTAPAIRPVELAATLSSAGASVPKDYVLVPGGYVHTSCARTIPNGATVKGNEVFDVDGAFRERTEPCAFPALRRPTEETKEPKNIWPTVNGFAEWTAQRVPTGATTWNKYTSTIIVPNAPSQQTGQTIFYFGGLVPDGALEILQPVLQWGPSSAGGGSYWSFGAWIVTRSSFGINSNTPLSRANPGDSLDTAIELVSVGHECDACPLQASDNVVCGDTYTWRVTARDRQTNQQEVGTFVLPPCMWHGGHTPVKAGLNELYPNAYPAVLEEWNMDSCPDPSNVAFVDISLSANTNQPLTSQVWQPLDQTVGRTSNNSPSCFYGADIGFQASGVVTLF